MGRKPIIDVSQYNTICEMYENWISVENIANQYNVSTKAIYNTLKRCNVKIRKCTDRKDKSDYITNKKYSFDEDYFEFIDNPDKAYWLGFLFADGSVRIVYNKNTGNTKGGSINITLKREDDYHLRNFVRFLNRNLIVKHTTSKCNNKIYECARLTINSITICGRNNICNFYNYIYGYATCILSRKKDLFTQGLIELNQPLNIGARALLAQNI